MPSSQQLAATGPLVPAESERVRFARRALTAALGVPGVLGADSGPNGTFVTEASPGERLPGVSCVAAPGGGYDVALQLIAGLVALHPLGEEVRAAVMRAAVTVGVPARSVSVHFAEVAATGEWR